MTSVRRFAILTISDRCSSGLAADLSGKFLSETIGKCDSTYFVVDTAIIADNKSTIEKILKNWCDHEQIDCIITNGGTGFTKRDVTPEATKAIAHRDAPGIVHALISGSLNATPMAMLSRLSAVIRHNTLIVNFPGSLNACRQCFEVLKPVLGHAIDQLRNDRNRIESTHCDLQSKNGKKLKSKVCVINVADRNRKSPFEMIEIKHAFKKIIELVQLYFSSTTIESLTKRISANEYHLYTGYTLAEDVFAIFPLPPFAASIKDGYAVIAEDGLSSRRVLPQSSVAGMGPKLSLQPGFCIRISTGAAVPSGANAVVQVEDTELLERTENGSEEALIKINSLVKVGQDIRPIGSDISISDKPLLVKKSILNSIEFGLLASTGVHSVSIYNRPRVAVISTGDEVISPGQNRPPNCIWDSNRIVLLGLLQSSNYHAVDLGIFKDNVDDIYQGFNEAFKCADLIITTGGVSMGERDLIKQVLREDFQATIHFGRVNLKPGKPTTFASCLYEGKLKFIFALPGNPVSAFVTYHIFVKPTLELLSGKYFQYLEQQIHEDPTKLMFHKTIRCRISLKSSYRLDQRPEFVRAIINFTHSTNPIVRLTESNQISSRLLNVKDANALVLLPSITENEGVDYIEDGALVNAILLL